jgi:ABC-2 type transport system permease protein
MGRSERAPTLWVLRRPPFCRIPEMSFQRWARAGTAAAVTSLTVILFVIPVLVFILPASMSNNIRPYLPGNAGQAIMNLVPQAHMLAPWVGLGVFAAYAFAAIAGAAVLLVRRDA